jgi:myo-inositol-1(or 4)-monophosphatase
MTDEEIAIGAARAGAAVIKERFADPGPAEMKGHNNPVTSTDTEAEAAIAAVLRSGRPDDGILGEEGSDLPGKGHGAYRRWIIDPLDGTVNYLHGFPHVAVSVALYESDKPRVGVILDPLRDETFVAVAGSGATLNGSAISVSAAPTLDGTLLGIGFPYDRHRNAAAYTASVTRALEVTAGVRRGGSAALDLAWVAAGRLDGYWEFDLAPWDLAAGILLVREAGGKVTDPFGRESTPWRRPCVATNGVIHQDLLNLLRDAIPPHIREDPV